MTTESFSQLAKIYGADIKRWPEEHRSMIGGLAATQFTAMRQILDEELTLDTLLNQDSISPASQTLLDSILLSASQAKIAKQPKHFWQNNDWLSRALQALGLTSIGLVGALTGVMFMSTMSSHLMINDNNYEELTVAEMVDFGQDWR